MSIKSHIIVLSLLIALLVGAPLRLSAQSDLWYTSDHALSSSLIKKIIHDRNDIIWIATENGLNRFDGSKFTAFHNIPGDSLSLASDFVNVVFESADGRLFVGTHNGLQIYDDATQTFSPPLALKGRDGSYTGAVSDMIQLPDGQVWVAGNDLLRVCGGDGRAWLDHAVSTDTITFIHRAVADHSNNVWFTRQTPGIYRLSPDNKITAYLTGDDGAVIESFAIGADNTLYAGTRGRGLLKYDRDQDRFSPVDLGDYSHTNIMSIYPDDSGHLLLATDGDGMVVYNLENGINWVYQIPNVDYRKLKVHSIDKDNYGNVWVGVYQKGLLKVPDRSGFFSSINQRNNGNIIGSSCVTALWRDRDDILWLGTDNDGIYAVSRWLASSRHYSEGVPPVIMALMQDSRGRLWAGSYGEGAGILDKATGRWRPVALPGTIDASKVYDFAETPGGDVLIATMGDGIFVYRDSEGRAVRLGERDSYNRWVTAVDVDTSTGNLLVSTYDGFYILDGDGGNPRHLLGGHIINTALPDPLRQYYWLGAADGLYKVSPQGEVMAEYSVADGLPGKSVYAIEDDGHYLWASTNHGLSRFDPQNETFLNFTVADGLPNNEFSKNASFRDDRGAIFFGGINGITAFRPADITGGGRKLSLRVTDFFVAGEPINARTLSDGKQIIDGPVYEAETFRLGPDDNTFSIRVNTKEMTDASGAEYFYAIDNGEWTPVITDTYDTYGGAIITFTNVPAGSHDIRVKVVDSGVESDILSVNVTIAHPWYRSWWMKAIYTLLGLLAIFMVWRTFSARQQRRRHELETRHNSEIMEAKLKFFTDISHEIRTPLSLVIGPVQRLIASDRDPERGGTYRTIERNAKRILRLVNELMDLRKIDNKQMKMRYSLVDLVGFINDVYETFQHSAQARGQQFTFSHPGIETLEVWIDRSNFDKILVNLLSNALKFTPKDGSVDVSLSVVDGQARISVTDTGIGIDDEDKQQVFDRFFQARNHTTGGTGIGLHLTHQLVELHHGHISVSDNPQGQGTRFTVCIPLGDAHIAESEKEVEKPVETPELAPAQVALDVPDLPEPDVEAEAETSAPHKYKETVFVVEDDKEIRRYISDNLSRLYKVATYANGKEALEAMHANKPDLVITDVMMPEMDGLTLTRKIRANINLNHIPVIILTAKTREEDNIEAMECGAAAFIKKPFNIDVLIKTVENQIASHQRLRNAYSGSQTQEDKIDEVKAVSNDERLMERVMREINRNLSNSDITVEMIAKNIGISRVHLHRKLKELTNQSTRDFIRNIRLQTAARILREKKLSVAEVSDMVGFKQPNNFSTCFKEMFGMSPTAYCAKHHSDKLE